MRDIMHAVDPGQTFRDIEELKGEELMTPSDDHRRKLVIKWMPTTRLCILVDAARRLGVATNTMARWAQRRDANKFPEPVYSYGHTIHVYDYMEIQEWYKTYKATRR